MCRIASSAGLSAWPWRALTMAAILVAAQSAYSLRAPVHSAPPIPTAPAPRMHWNPLIVLVAGDRFEPAVDPEMYVHPTWTRWPETSSEAGDNRILSVVTGLDWAEDLSAFGIRAEASPGIWRAMGHRNMSARGFFRAKSEMLLGTGTALLADLTGNPQRASQVLALEASSPIIRTYHMDDVWPSGKLMVLCARNGEDVRAATSRTFGRALVIEFPPRAGQNWSRLWLQGRSWPVGRVPSEINVPEEFDIHVPGLVRSQSLGSLVLRPGIFRWRKLPNGWSGANRWMRFVQGASGPASWILGITVAAVAFAAAYCAAQERRVVALDLSLRILILVPGAIVVGGNLALLGGLSGGWVWTGIAFLGLVGLAVAIGAIRGNAIRAEPLLGFGIVGFAALILTQPTFSLFSDVFGQRHGESVGIPMGALFVAFSIWLPIAGRWAGFFVALVLAALSVAGHFWWNETSGNVAAWWLVAWAVSRGLTRVAAALALASTAPCLISLFEHGVVFAPHGLLTSIKQQNAINLYDLVRFWASPAILGAWLVVGFLALFSSPFLVHQIRTAWIRRTLARRLTALGLLFVLAGWGFSPFLYAGFVCACAGGIILLEALTHAEPPLE